MWGFQLVMVLSLVWVLYPFLVFPRLGVQRLLVTGLLSVLFPYVVLSLHLCLCLLPVLV